MLSPKRPMDVAAAGLAVALGAIAFMQWRSAEGFVQNAVTVNGTVVELRTAKKVLFDAEAEIYATVEFLPEGTAGDQYTGGGAVNLPMRRAELPTPVQRLQLNPNGLVGMRVPIRYDPANPASVRYGNAKGHQGAMALALLAVGALFIPIVLRRSSLAAGGGG